MQIINNKLMSKLTLTNKIIPMYNSNLDLNLHGLNDEMLLKIKDILLAKIRDRLYFKLLEEVSLEKHNIYDTNR